MARPVLISGLQRSGTTWTARMLTLSDEMFYVLEPFNILRDPIHLIGAGTNFPYFQEVDSERYVKIRSGLGLSFTKDELRVFMKQSPSPKYHLYHIVRYLSLNRRLNKGMKPVIQDPFAVFMAPWLSHNLGILPLFLFRHPAAYINSMKRMKWGFNFAWLADQEELMDEYLSDFSDDIRKWAGEEFIPFSIETQCLVWNIFTSVILRYSKEHSNWLFYRHEDLSMNPMTLFYKIYAEIGIDMNQTIMRKIEKFTGSGNPATARDGKMHSLKRNSRENIKNWQKQLSVDEINQIHHLTAAFSNPLYSEDEWH